MVPTDLIELSRNCGGLWLFKGADFPWHVHPVTSLTPAGPRLLGAAEAAQIATDYPDDLTNGCASSSLMTASVVRRLRMW